MVEDALKLEGVFVAPLEGGLCPLRTDYLLPEGEHMRRQHVFHCLWQGVGVRTLRDAYREGQGLVAVGYPAQEGAAYVDGVHRGLVEE